MKEKNMPFRLAVYGTLKEGYPNHKYISNCEKLGACWVSNFALVTEGYYPAAFRFAGRTIWCEVYKVDEHILARTDALEGVSSGYYSRETVNTVWGTAFMYARLTKNLVVGEDGWFPDGIWEGNSSRMVAWEGWQKELAIFNAQEQRRVQEGWPDREATDPYAAQAGDGYAPPKRKTGRMKREVTEHGEVIYVPAEEIYGPPIKQEEKKSIIVPPFSKPWDPIVKYTPPPSKREIAMKLIDEGKKDTPSEEVA